MQKTDKSSISIKLIIFFAIFVIGFAAFIIFSDMRVGNAAYEQTQQTRFAYNYGYAISRALIEFADFRIFIRDNINLSDIAIRQNATDFERALGNLRIAVGNYLGQARLSNATISAIERDFAAYLSSAIADGADFFSGREPTMAAPIINPLESALSASLSAFSATPARNLEYFSNIRFINIIAAVSIIIFALGVFIYVHTTFAKPLGVLGGYSAALAKGEKIQQSSGFAHAELEILRQNMCQLSEANNNFVVFVQDASKRVFGSGRDIGGQNCAELGFITKLVQDIVDFHFVQIAEAQSALRHIALGNFTENSAANLSALQLQINQTMAALKNFVNDATNLAKSAAEANFDPRINTNQLDGEWKNMANSLNAIMTAAPASIAAVVTILGKIAQGRMDEQMPVNLPGDFDKIKIAANTAIDMLSAHITEIGNALNSINRENYDYTIQSPFPGVFGNIRTSLWDIARKSRTITTEIRTPAPRERDPRLTARQSMASQATERSKESAANTASRRVSGAAKVGEAAGSLEHLRHEFNKSDFGKY